MSAVSPAPDPRPSPAPRLYYDWIVLLVAAVAMVGTLPGRTQGLGLITEPLLADLRISRVRYAELNFWATIIGSAGAIGIGQLIARLRRRVSGSPSRAGSDKAHCPWSASPWSDTGSCGRSTSRWPCTALS